MEESAPYGTFSLKKGESVTGLRERRCTPKPTNDCYPTRRCGLPCALIFTAHIGAVDHLIAIDRVSVHHHAQRGIDGRLEAHRNLSKVKIDVGHDLTRLHGNGVEAEAVVVAGEQVARQHLIARVVIGFVEDTVVEPCAVSAGGERRGTRHIIGDLIVPEEGFQRHVGGIGHRQIVAHGLARHDLRVAALGDADAEAGGLIVGRELDDLTGIFQRHIMHGGIELPIGGRCDLSELIAGQRQRFAGRDAPGVRRDVVHHLAAAGIDDLINSALERGACGGASDLVILSGVLINLDLARDSGIFPLDLHGLARRDIDGLILLIQRVAGGGFQFSQIKAAAQSARDLVNVDISPVIRGILADGLLVRVIEDKLHPVDPLSRGAVDFVDDDAAELFVGHLKRHTLAVLDLKIVGRVIQPERFVRCDLFCIVAAILQSHEHTAIFVRRNGIHQGIVHLADLKGRIGDALTVVILVDLDDLHATNRRVVEVESLCVVGIDHNSLRASVFINGVTGDRFDLCDHHGAGNTGNGDFTRLIRPVQAGGGQRAALGIYIRAICVGDLKLDTFQRLLCHGILLNYDQVALGLVTELYRDNFIGLDLNRLRGIIENVPRLRAGFLDDKCGAGGDVRNGERACAVRHELAVGVSDEIAVGIRDKELHVRDGSVRHSVHLFHEHAAPGLIAELQRHHGIAFDFDALRGIVQNVAVFCPYLPGDDCHAGGQAVNADGARAIGHILSVGIADHAAVRIGDEELHIGNGGAGHGVLFDNKQRTHLIVAEGHGNDVLILTGEIDRFRGVGDHIPIRRGDLLADISACGKAR